MGTVVRRWSMVHSEFYRRRYGRPAQAPMNVVQDECQIRMVSGQPADRHGTSAVVKVIRPGGARAAR